MALDTISILIALGVLNCSLCVAMLLIWRFLLSQKAMLIWGVAMGCAGCGNILVSMSSYIPPLFSITVPNLLIAVCCALVWWGCSIHYGTEPFRRTIMVSLALFTLVQAWFSHGDPDIVRRTITLSLFIVLHLTGALVTMLKAVRWRPTGMERAVALSLLLNILFRALIAGVQLHDMSYRVALGNNYIILISALLSLFGVTFWGLAVILMMLEKTVSCMRIAENASNAAREMLETVIDSIPSLIYLKDRQGRLLVCNRRLADFVGVDRDETMGKTSRDFFPPSLAEQQTADDMEVLCGGEMLVTHESVELADGIHIFQTTKLPVRDGQGAVVSLCGISTDVTEQKRIEERLREAELRLRAIVQSQIIGVVIIDTSGALLEANDAFLLMLGYTREEYDALGLRWDAITPPEYREQEKRIVRQLREEFHAHPWEKECFRRDGGRVPVLAGAAGFKKTGDEVRAVCFVIDLSERKEAETALRESRRLFNSIANTSPAMVWMSGLDRGCTWFNHTWLGFTGRSLAQEQGNGWTEGVHPDDLDRCLAIYSEAFDARRFFAMEYRLRHSDGEYRWILDQGHPRYDASGSFAGYIGSCLDISEHKRAEEEINRKNMEIEQFIYAVSHDLRSPLITFSSFLRYLEEDMATGDEERIARDLGFIHKSVDRMDQLLGELLEMSRIGRQENPPTRVTFAELAREALSSVAGQITARGVTVHVAEADLTLTGDRPRLAQIWQNLLDNAVKYLGDQRTPLVEVGVDRMNGETVFFVRDNGIGIPPDCGEKVFGMFDKLDRSSSGVGLGLAMVRKIVEKQHGRIWVESGGLGSGACFRFTLPDALAFKEEG